MEEGIDNNLEASDESLDRYSGDFNTPDLQMQQYEVSPQSQYLMIGNVDKLVTPPRDLNLRNSNRLYCNLQLSDYQKSFNSQLKQAQSILVPQALRPYLNQQQQQEQYFLPHSNGYLLKQFNDSCNRQIPTTDFQQEEKGFFNFKLYSDQIQERQNIRHLQLLQKIDTKNILLSQTKESMDKNQPGISQGLMTAGISIKGNKEQQISKMESIVSQLKQQEQKQPYIQNLLDFLDDGAKNPSY